MIMIVVKATNTLWLRRQQQQRRVSSFVKTVLKVSWRVSSTPPPHPLQMMMQIMYCCMFAFPAGCQNEDIFSYDLHSIKWPKLSRSYEYPKLAEIIQIDWYSKTSNMHTSSRRPSFQKGTNTLLAEQQIDTRIQKQTNKQTAEEVFRFRVFPQLLVEPFFQEVTNTLFLADKQIVIQKHQQRPLNTRSRILFTRQEYLLEYDNIQWYDGLICLELLYPYYCTRIVYNSTGTASLVRSIGKNDKNDKCICLVVRQLCTTSVSL